MKTAETRTASNTIMRKSNPFFSKESDRHFFGSQQRASSTPALSSSVQAKLNVGSPNDPYEREADSTADKVVQRLAEPGGGKKSPSISSGGTKADIQEKCDGCDQEDKLQKKGEEEISGPDKKLQRKPIFESNAEAPDDENEIRLKCEECEKEGAVQKRENESDHTIPNTDIEKQLNSSRGSGTALPENTRHQMESSIGADFSNVRIHHDANAAELSKNLNAQAFTHGKDIYFNSGKYDTSSKEGQHLLAHELTHTIQQGESKIERKVLDGAPAIQKAPAAPGSQPPEGKMDKTSSGFTITLTNFPLKRYANPYAIPPHPVMPKGKRDTDQKKIWTDASKNEYEKFITDMIAAGNLQNEPLLRFTLKSNTKAELIGTKEQIIHEIAVPFWDLGGHAVINEVEHAVDYQILGNDADNIDNLILLDKNSNGQLGRIVNGNVNAFLNRILNFYQPTFPELAGITAQKARKDPQYIITYEGFNMEPVSLGNSLISISNVKGVNTPFKPEFAEIKKAEIPPDHFLLKTNTDRTGYLLPYSPTGKNVGRFYMVTEKDSKGMLESITLDPLVNGGKFVEIKETKKVKIINENKVKDVFLINSKALAARMKGFIGVKYFSPVKFEEPEFTPGFGMKAVGKVDPSLDFLKDNNIDISFELQDSEFSVKASISDIVKFPKPFEVTDTSLWIQISSKNGLTVGGDLGFKIDKVGSGRLSMIKGAETFGVTGDFIFDSKKFEGSKVGFEYKDNKWSFKGTINVKDITGVKEASLDVSYAEEKVKASGHATLDVPGVDKITLNASFDKDGGFLIAGDATLKSMPGIKSGGTIHVTLEKTAAKPDYILSVSGEVEPNLPKIPKLNPKLSLSYVDGLFKAEGKTDFGTEGGLISGNVTVGVTNANVEDGKIVAGQKKELSFYGNGKLSITPINGVTLDLFIKVDTKGVALFSADLKASFSPFPPLKPDPKSILDIEEDFPLFGVPFLSINFHMKLGASLYLEWIPLTICISGKITDKTYDELVSGKFDADFCMTLQTSGKVGLKVTIGAGVSVTVAVLKGGADLNGSLSLELNALVKGTLNAKWGEKGFKLKDGLGEAQANLELFPSLNGRVYVDLDLLVSRSNLWHRDTKSVEGQHITLYTTGIKVPFEFDDNNQLKPLNFEKITFEPKLDKDTGKEQADKAANPDGKKPSPDDLVNEKKNIIRQQIRKNFQNAGKNQSYDRYTYATDLRATLVAKADPALVSFISEAIETEFKWVELDDFDKFKNALISSKDPIAQRLARIDAFQKDYSTVPKDNFEMLRGEIKSQAPDSSNNSVVQKKELEGDPNPGNDARIKKNAAVPPRAPENAGLDDKIPKIKSSGSTPHKNTTAQGDADKSKSSSHHEKNPEMSARDSVVKVQEGKKPPVEKPKTDMQAEPGQKKKYNLKNYREESPVSGSSVKDKIKPPPVREPAHDRSAKSGPASGGGGHSGFGAGTTKQTDTHDQHTVPEKEIPGTNPSIKDEDQYLLIEDSATASKNQMRKTDFLRLLESEMTSHLKTILTGTGIGSNHILYIQTSIAKLRENSAASLEQSIRKFEPSTSTAKTTRQIIDQVLSKFIHTAREWEKTKNLSLIRDFFIGNEEGHAPRYSPEVREFSRLIQVNEHASKEKIQRHPVAPTPVERKTKLQIFGLGIFLGGMTLSEFNEYTIRQADWFTEPTLTTADRKDLWRLLTKSRPENPTLSGVGDLALNQLRTVTDADWLALNAYCEGCDSRFHSVKLTPSGFLPERIALGSILKTLASLAGGPVLESTITEVQLKQIKTENLIIPLSIYLSLFKPFLEQTTDAAKKLAVGVKSEIQLLLDFVKAPGALVFLPLLGKVRNLHRFAPDALMQLQNNFMDFSHTKPLYLILYSGHDNNSAFLESKTLFENLIKDRSKLVLMLEAQESVQSIIDQVPDIAKNFGMPDITGTNQIAQVMIAGHGSSRSVELAGAGPAVAGDVGNYHTESLDLDKNNKRAIDLLSVLMDHMDPATARIVFAGCLVGAKNVSVKDAAGNLRTAVDTKNQVNNPASESLAQTTRNLAATRGKAGMPVEGARASVALADSRSLQDAAGNLHIDYTMDPTAFGMGVVYVATGKEPEGLMRAAVEIAAVNPVIAANQLKIRLNLPAINLWYDKITRIFVTEAIAGIGPGAPADIAKLNQLAAMADHFLMSLWGTRSVAYFGDAVNPFPAMAVNLYTQVLATPEMTAPAGEDTQMGRFILELAWSMMSPARAANVITFLDTHAALKPDNLKSQLDIAWLNAANASAALFPPAAAATNGRIRLALAWMKKDNANADVIAFLNTQVDGTGPRPRLLPNIIAQLANPAEEDGLLSDLGQVPMVVPIGGGRARPPANADAFPNGRGPAMNDVRIEPEVYIATVIPPAYYLNVRKQPTLAGDPFTRLKRGDTVQVMGFVHQWAAVDIKGRLGFAHSRFLSNP